MIWKILKRLVIAVFVLAIISFAAYTVIYSTFSGIDTEKIMLSKVSDSIMTTGLVLREESIITADSGSYISYTAGDGTKVNDGGTVAKTFASLSATTNQAERERISTELENIKKLNTNLNNLSVSIDVVESQIYSSLKDFSSAEVTGDYSKLRSTRENLLYYMNERKYLTGEQTSFKDRIAVLEEKMSNFPDEEGELTGTVTTDKSGVFTSIVDGYENSYDFNKIADITREELDAIKPAQVEQSAIGKLVTYVDWYVVCPVTADEALTLSTTEEQIKLTFLTSATSQINAQLVSVNQKDKQSGGVAVFSCDTMNSKLINMRNEEVKIDLREFSGLRVPKKSLRTVEREVSSTDSDGNITKQTVTVQGVYIKYVNELIFREIVILYSADNYVICDPTPEEESLQLKNGTISHFDEVVTEGADLYDGKVVK